MKLIRISRSDLVADGAERRWLLEHVPWGMILANLDNQAECDAVLRFQTELVRHQNLPGEVTIDLSDYVRERVAASLQNRLTDLELPEHTLARSTWFQLLSPTTEAEWKRRSALMSRVERLYHWVGLDPKGEEVSGELEADTQEEAIAKLRRQGVYPTTVQVAPDLPARTEDPPDVNHVY